MEEYKKIWENVDPDPERGFVFSDEIWKKYYTTYKILNNTFRSVVDFCASEDDTKRGEGQMTRKSQNLRNLCSLYKNKIKWRNQSDCWYSSLLQSEPDSPQKSLLDAVQQQVYCYMCQKLREDNKTYLPTKEENILFAMLNEMVLQERPMFCKYVEHLWITQQKRCHDIHPEIKKYVDTVWKCRLDSVNTYPQQYCNVKMIPLVFAGNKTLVRALPAPKVKESTGVASRYVPPVFGTSLKITTDSSEIESSFPPENFTKKVPVSRDEIAQKIASSCGHDIVISMGGLKCIIDNVNPGYDREWDIPVLVRDEKICKDSVYIKRVVYIDKPLPPRSMSAVDKNKWYFKYGVRALLCSPRRQQVPKSVVPVSPGTKNVQPSQTVQDTSAGQGGSRGDDIQHRNDDAESEKGEAIVQSSDEENMYASDSSTDRLVIACSDEERGTGTLQQRTNKVTCQSDVADGSCQKKSANKKIKSQDCNATENNARDPLNKIVCIKDIPKTIKTYGKQLKEDAKVEGASGVCAAASSTSSVNLDSHRGDCEAGSAEEKWTSEVCEDNGTLMSNSNVNYRSWKLMLEKDSQEETRANFLKGESSYKPIVILVRNRQDAVWVKDGVVYPVFLAPKLEYQAEYGMELPSMSEINRQWASLYFRHNCTLIRARIDVPSQQLLVVEQKKIEQVARESSDQRIRCSLLSILYSVLLGLLDVEPGSYLLSHRKKMGAFASLMRATNQDGSFDLKKLYDSVDIEGPELVQEIPWPPIDVSLQTPTQYKQRRAPGLFKPCTVFQSPQKKPQSKVVKYKRPNKKKKKTSGKQTSSAAGSGT